MTLVGQMCEVRGCQPRRISEKIAINITFEIMLVQVKNRNKSPVKGFEGLKRICK